MHDHNAHPPAIISDPDQVATLGQARAAAQWAWFDALQRSGALTSDAFAQQMQQVLSTIMAAIDCRTCGRCCRHMGPTLSDADQQRLAEAWHIDIAELRQRWLRPMWPDAPAALQTWLLPDPCPLHDGLLCTIYEVRPQVCRDFPEHVGETPAARLQSWIESARICPITFNTVEHLRSLPLDQD